MSAPIVDPATRLRALVLTGVVFALVAVGLVLGLRMPRAPHAVQRALSLFTVPPDAPPPPPLPPPPPRPQPVRRHPTKEGASAPANLRSRATELVVPVPPIPPVPPPMVTSQQADSGSDATSGNAAVPGPGTGAGGAGNGTGSGRSGNGSGYGGRTPPIHIRGALHNSDYPPEAARDDQQGELTVEFYVMPTGRVADCRIVKSSGSAALDDTSCRLITERYRYKPSYDAEGRPVRSIIIKDLSWEIIHHDSTR